MAKLIGVFVIGLGLGAGVVLLVMGATEEPEPLSPSPPSPPIERLPNASISIPSSSPQVNALDDIQALTSEFERSAALYARLQSADVDALEILLDEVEGLTNPQRVKLIIYSRYVQLDPRAALDRLREEERDRRTLIPNIVWEAASLDLDATLAFTDTLDRALQAQSARYILGLDSLSDARKEQIAKRFGLEPDFWRLQASSLAKNDPAAAWQTALAIEEAERKRQTLWSVALTWFETDPFAALSAVAAIEGRQAGSWQSSLLRRWVSQNPDAALEWALARPADKRPDPLRQVAAEVAKHSPQKMYELVETLAPPRRNQVAEGVLRAWGRADPVAALDALAAMGDAPQLRKRVGVSLVESWAENDPTAAVEWVRAQEPSPIRTSMLKSALANLAESDPRRALTFAEDFDGTVRATAIERVLRVWAKDDPRGAASWLDASGDMTRNAVAAVAQRFADVAPEEAFEWLLDQSVEAQRSAVPYVVGRIAADSPESALRLVNRVGDSHAKQFAGFQLIWTWADTDPRAAVRAIAHMDDSMSQQLYQTAFRSWSVSDPESAMAFLDRLRSSDRDHAILGMLQHEASANADVAERLFDRVTDDEVRRQAATALFVNLREVDPERAEHYRELSGVTD